VICPGGPLPGRSGLAEPAAVQAGRVGHPCRNSIDQGITRPAIRGAASREPETFDDLPRINLYFPAHYRDWSFDGLLWLCEESCLNGVINMDYRRIGIRIYRIFGCGRYFFKTGLAIIGLISPVACFSQINSNHPGTILWEVSPRGNEAFKSYILGTEHLYSGSFIDTIKEIKQGILTADFVAGEGNIPEQEPIGFNPATEKVPYKELMDSDDYSLVDRYLTEHGFRSLEELDSARYPIGKLANYVFRDAGTQAFDLDPQNEPSMDAYVQKLARSHKIPYHALDSGLSINDSVLAFGNSEVEFADFLVNFVKLSKDSLRVRYGRIHKMASFDINYSSFALNLA